MAQWTSQLADGEQDVQQLYNPQSFPPLRTITNPDPNRVSRGSAARGDYTVVGMRWKDVQVPRGATITYAELQTYPFPGGILAPNWIDIDITCFGMAYDDVAPWPLSGVTDGPDQRTRTVSPIRPAQGSPFGGQMNDPHDWRMDFSSIVQQITDRPGWAKGNALALVVSGFRGTFNAYLDIESSSAGPGELARLTIDYTVPTQLDTKILTS